MDSWLRLDFTLRVGPGDLRVTLTGEGAVGLVGPSGIGKTTILRVLAGVERRAQGTVVFEGETWQAPGTFRPAWERHAAWVPQESHLFPHLTVRENLGYGGGDPASVATLLGVAPLLERAPRNLSGGERQRVALGRALLASPRVLLLDEPFSALDRSLRRRVAGDVAAWCSDRGLRVVIVSHDPEDLQTFGAVPWEIADGTVRRSTGGNESVNGS